MRRPSGIHRRWCPILLAVALFPAALPGCAPVIETTLRDRQPAPAEERSIERISVLLDTSRLQRTDETIDPARLRVRLEEELASSGVFRQYRVAIADAPADMDPFGVTVALTRLEYTKRGVRFPPPPPLGIACLYPAVAPVLFEREYLKLEVDVEAELSVRDRSGVETSRTYLAESATGRADFFGSGESAAVTALQDIAFRNFSEQVVREILFLTR